MKILSMKAAVVGTGLLALSPLGAEAAPSAFVSQCGAITIKNQTGATLMRDTEDCSLIWVLPPTAGTTQLTGFTPSGNLGMCEEVKSVRNISRRLKERMEKVSRELDDLTPEHDKAKKKVEVAMAKVREHLNKTEAKQLYDLQLDLQALEDRIGAANSAIEKCSGNCDEYELEYRALAKRRMQLSGDIRQLRRQHYSTLREYDRAQAELASAQRAEESVGGGIQAVVSQQKKFNQELIELQMAYSKWEGGYAHLDYDTGWDQAVIDLTRDYGSQYQFRKINTKDARVYANLVGAADQMTYLSSMPAILDYSLNGLKYQPYGEEKVPEFSALPSRLAGAVRLSLMGGCPLYYKNFLDADSLEKADGTPESYKFAISTTYKYPAAYHLKMTASYNLFKFYEKIVESSSSGGFFSSHTATSVAENRIDRDAFHIEWKVEDPDSKFDESARQDIATSLKLELIGRVLGTMAQPVFQNAPNLSVPAPVPGQHGAIVLADGLNSVCGATNIWCTSGAWLLRGLDAMFGNDSAVSTYRSTHDSTATETWDTTSVKWNTGASVFTTKEKI